MIAEEGGRAGLVDLAGRDHQDELDQVGVIGFQAPAVEEEKKIGGGQRRSLVSVDEKAAPRDPEEVGGCEVEKVGLPVGFLLQRSGERGLEHPDIADTGRPPVEAQLLGVEGLEELPRMMDGHLASAR